MGQDERFGGESVENLYKGLVPILAGWAGRRLGRDDGHDAAQVAFERALRRFDPAFEASFKSFAFRVLAGVVNDELRRRQRRPSGAPLEAAGEPSTSHDQSAEVDSLLHANDLVRRLTHAIDGRFPRDERLRLLHHAVLRHIIQREFQPELAVEELQDLAARHGVKPPVISQARARIKQLMRELLQGEI